MPLARIVTRHPQQAAAVAEYLQSRGYITETVDPGAFLVTPAEVEVAIDGCTPEQALARAVRAVEEGAPKAAPAPAPAKHSEAVAYDIAGRPVEFADEEASPEAGGNALQQAAEAFRQGWRDLKHESRRVLRSVGSDVRQLAAALDRQRARRAQLRQEQQRVREKQERERRERLIAAETERARRDKEERERQEAQRQATRERHAQEQARREAEQVELQRRHAEDEARLRAKREAELRAAAEERTRHEAEERARREAEERARREAEARARRDAEAHERMIRSQQREAAAPAVPQVAAAEAAVARRPGVPALVLAEVNQRELEWKKAFAIAAAIVVLVTLGFAAYSNRRPANPLSVQELFQTSGTSQESPFGKATAAPPAAPPAAGAAAQPAAPQGAAAAPPPPAPSTQVRRRHPDEDYVAEPEVVIRRYPRYRSDAQQAAQSEDGVKRYSDLDE